MTIYLSFRPCWTVSNTELVIRKVFGSEHIPLSEIVDSHRTQERENQRAWVILADGRRHKNTMLTMLSMFGHGVYEELVEILRSASPRLAATRAARGQ